MPTYNIRLTTPIAPTFRTHQVAGLFDLSLDELAGERLAHTLTAELPGMDEDWTIGAIVGPSGSGKTTLARAAYGDALYQPPPWPDDAAIIDALEQMASGRRKPPDSLDLAQTQPHRGAHAPRSPMPLKDLLRLLTAVGLASPPIWLKPYRLLSTGERFRADLARAILASGVRQHPDGAAPMLPPRHREADASRSPFPRPSLLVFDEFTSTLDRTVACTASFALSKFLRQSQDPGARDQEPVRNAPLAPGSRLLASLRFVCLSCHTDFLPWLAPDWILDLSSDNGQLTTDNGQLTTNKGRMTNDQGHFRPFWPRGSLHRPPLRLAVRRVPQRLWRRFARHHYLSGGLSAAATCYAAFWEDTTWRAGCVSTPMASRLQTARPPHREADASRSPELPIAFCAVVATLGWKRTKRITRLVVLPEFQGLGLGSRLAETVAAAEAAKGNRVTITASHPSVVAWCSRSPRWKYLGLKKTGSTRQQLGPRAIRCSTGRSVASFEFVGCMSAAKCTGCE